MLTKWTLINEVGKIPKLQFEVFLWHSKEITPLEEGLMEVAQLILAMSFNELKQIWADSTTKMDLATRILL